MQSSFLRDQVRNSKNLSFKWQLAHGNGSFYSPGVESARSGHHFAYKGNNFWKMIYGAGEHFAILFSSFLPFFACTGFTDRLLPAAEDVTMAERHNVGVINLVDRPTSSVSTSSSCCHSWS